MNKNGGGRYEKLNRQKLLNNTLQLHNIFLHAQYLHVLKEREGT